MRKNSSKHKNAKYPNLYRMPNKPYWVFRKFSAEKQKPFYCSTGLEANDRNAPAAYKIGVDKFNLWLGAFLPKEGAIYVRDLARAFLSTKDDPQVATSTFRNIKNQIENHIIPSAGHLKPSKVTKEWWVEYQRQERKRSRQVTLINGTVKDLPPRTKLFNTHKVLVQILGMAVDRGLLETLPQLPLSDGEAAPPRYIQKEDILKIIRFAGRISSYKRNGSVVPESRYGISPIKLLVLIMWKQGARPTEILQYKWSMIRWNEGKFGTIDIPAEISKNRKSRSIPLNSKVSRILRFLRPHAVSDWIFPSPKVPGERIKDYSSAWDSVMDRLGLDYDIYNLRDTFITSRLKEGISAVFIGKYVQNSAAMIEKRYAVALQETLEGIAQ